MTHRSAEKLFAEYLRSGDPQVRRNALTALAASSLESRFKEVVRAGIVDADPLVRQRALDEIAGSGTLLSGGYASVLSEVIASPSHNLEAYRMAGRLRSRGASISLSTPWLKKLRMAFRERMSKVDRVKGAVKMAFIGGIVTFILLWVYLDLETGGKLAHDEVGAGLMITGALIPGILVMLTRRWWRPIQAEGDRSVALCLELVLLAIAGSLSALFASILEFPSMKGKSTATALAVSALGGGLSFCAVRAGTVLAHGARNGLILNRVLQTLAGFTAGLLTLTVVAIEVGVSYDPVTSAVWVMLIPALAGLAAAFSRADFEAYSETGVRRIAGGAAFPLTVFLLAAWIIFSTLPLIPDFPQRQTSSKTNGTITRITAHDIPVSEHFTVKTPQLVHISVPRYVPAAGGLKAELHRNHLNLDSRSVSPNTPVLIDEYADGSNEYEVILYAEIPKGDEKVTIARILSFTASRAKRGWQSLSHTAGAYTVEIDQDPVVSLDAVVQQAMTSTDVFPASVRGASESRKLADVTGGISGWSTYKAIAGCNLIILNKPPAPRDVLALAYHLRGVCRKDLGDGTGGSDDMETAKRLGYQEPKAQ